MAQVTPPLADTSSPKGAIVLLVDGNEEHQILSVAALGRQGFRVAVADSGREALRLATARLFDAIVVAHKPKDAPGIEVLRLLHERRPGVPKIFLVPEGADDLALRGMRAGASGYMMKTPRFHELLPGEVATQIAKARTESRVRDQEKALEESRSRIREFVEMAQDPIFVVDPTGSFVAFNNAMCAATGYGHAELLRMNLFDLLSPRSSREEARRLIDLSQGGPPGVLEFALARKDGQEIFMSMTPHLVQRDGEVAGIEVLARDVTDRKRAERELRDLYGWLRAIHEATDEAILLTDLDLRVVHWNTRALDLFGKDSASMAGQTADALLRELAGRATDPKPILRALEAYAEDPESVSDGTIRLQGVGGRAFWRMSTPVRNPAGELIGRLWTFREITDQQRVEEVQRAIYRIAQAANVAKDLPNLYASIHRIVGELMPAKNFYIALHDPATDSLDFSYFVDEAEPPPARAKAGRGLTEYVIRTGLPLLVSPEGFRELVSRGEVESVGPPSVDWLGVPLFVGDLVLGALVVQTYTEGVRFSRQDQEILTFVSNQVAQVIERKRADEALRESEDRFRRLAENAPDLIYRVRLEPSRVFDYVSPASTGLTGYTPEEHYADPDLPVKMVHPEDRARFLAVLQDPPPSGEPVSVRLVRKDGTVIWTEHRNAVIRDPGGKPVAFEGIVRDITAQVAAQEELRRSEERFRRLAENAPDLIYRYRTSEPRGFEYVSPAATSFTGYTPEEHYADPDLGLKLIHPDDRSIIEGMLSGSPPAGEPVLLRWIRKDGRILWTEQRNIAVRDSGGKIVAIEGIARDVTARVESEREVRASEERFRLLAKATKDAIWDWDPETDTLVWGESIYEILGHDPEEVPPTGAWWDARIHPEDRERAVSTERRALYEGVGEWTLEYRVQRKDGFYALVLDRAFVLRDAEQRPVRAIGSITDITERRKAEESLRRRDAAMAAVGFAAEEFLRRSRWEDAVPEVLRRLGEALQVSRVWIFQNEVTPDGTLVTSQRFEWTAPGVSSQADNPAHWSYPVREGGFQRWAEILGRGDVIRGHIRDFPDAEREELLAEDIRSICVVPILVGGSWWGHVGFDECSRDREWTAHEIEVLKAAAGTLATAITRQQAEDALRESESRYRSLFETNPNPMWVYDMDTYRFLAVNEAAIKHYGYSPEEFLKMTIKDIRPAEDVPALERTVASTPPGYSHAGLWRHRKKDGTIILVDISSHTLSFAGRRADLVLVSDVTEREKAREALERSEAKFRAIFEAAVEAILLLDGRGTILDANPAAEALSRRKRSELLGSNVASLLSQEELPRAQRFMRDLLDGKRVDDPLESWIEVPPGERRILEVRARVLRKVPGSAQLELFVRDVTEQRDMQRKLVQSERLASIGQLAAYVAHEINTPLTSISLLTSSLSRRIEDPELREKLDKITAQRRQAATIISDLLKFTKQREIIPVATDLREVIELGVEQASAYRREGVDLAMELGGEPVLVRVDPLQMQEVVVNLLKNAFEATAAGSVAIRLEVRADQVAIRIADTGTGMGPEVKARLFEPFFTTKKAGQGTGLGLSLSHGIVTAHGGKIEVASELGKGTTFTVLLPRGEAR